MPESWLWRVLSLHLNIAERVSPCSDVFPKRAIRSSCPMKHRRWWKSIQDYLMHSLMRMGRICRLLNKANIFQRDNTSPERDSSLVVHSPFSLRNDVITSYPAEALKCKFKPWPVLGWIYVCKLLALGKTTGAMEYGPSITPGQYPPQKGRSNCPDIICNWFMCQKCENWPVLFTYIETHQNGALEIWSQQRDRRER